MSFLPFLKAGASLLSGLAGYMSAKNEASLYKMYSKNLSEQAGQEYLRSLENAKRIRDVYTEKIRMLSNEFKDIFSEQKNTIANKYGVVGTITEEDILSTSVMNFLEDKEALKAEANLAVSDAILEGIRRYNYLQKEASLQRYYSEILKKRAGASLLSGLVLGGLELWK